MKKLIFILFLFSTLTLAQKVNIVPILKKIESGEIDQAKTEFRIMKLKNAHHPDLIFLEGVLTENGEEAQKFYESLYTNFPESDYADAALYRSYTYFYAIGLYKKADELKQQLIKDYPQSPYISYFEQVLTNEDDMIMVNAEPYQIKNEDDPKFTIQAGAFSNAQNAEELKRKFIDKGYTSRVTEKKVGNLTFRIVDVGEFFTREEAEKFLPDLEAEFSIKGRIKDFE